MLQAIDEGKREGGHIQLDDQSRVHYHANGTGTGAAPGGINLPKAWASNQGKAEIVVAVVDTGILPDHPDITGSPNLLPGYDMITEPAISNDGDGRDTDPTDSGDAIVANECYLGSPAQGDSWHGTHVAGTVGVGHTNNGSDGCELARKSHGRARPREMRRHHHRYQ